MTVQMPTQTKFVMEVSVELHSSIQELSRVAGKSELVKLAGRRDPSAIRVWRGSQGTVPADGYKVEKC